jgi:SAM-dependent methyltransferase
MGAPGATPLDYAAWRGTTLGLVTERLERRAVLDLAGPLDGLDVLEVGCGDGAWSVHAARAGARVTGLDRSGAALEAARRRAGDAGVALAACRGDAGSLPFPAASFDLVLAITVLCFVDDPAGAVREMARVLRPGGRLVLGELGSWSLWGAWRRLRGWAGSPRWRKAHLQSPAGLRSLARQAGLRPGAMRGAAFHPPLGAVARILAPLDPVLGRHLAVGAAFIALEATRAPDVRE